MKDELVTVREAQAGAPGFKIPRPPVPVHPSMKNHARHAVETSIKKSELIRRSCEIFSEKVSAIGPFVTSETAAEVRRLSAENMDRIALVNEWYADNIHADAFPHLATEPPVFD